MYLLYIMSLIKEERSSSSLNSEQNESDDSQNITGSLKENQGILEKEFEYNKNEIIEAFSEINQIKKEKKKVSFKDEKNLVSIIEVESYKKYNAPIEIGGKKIKKKNEEKYPKKKRKDVEDQKEMEFADKYYDKDEDSGKSCNIF